MRSGGNLDGTVADLGTLPGGIYSYANDISDAGAIVGLSPSGTGGGRITRFAGVAMVQSANLVRCRDTAGLAARR